MKLLSVENDAKTKKGAQHGVLTGILYLAPHTLSGYQVCPKSTPGCRAACLFTAGRGVYDSVQQARLAKTKMFFEARELFMSYLADDIRLLELQAAKRGMRPAVRLNGTSDIAWEKIVVGEHRNLFEMYPNVSYYDYTKVYNRKAALRIRNYHLTFSLSEENEADARRALSVGFNVAVVMHLGKHEPKPATFWGYDVVDGDKHDARFLNRRGVIVALSAKGLAKQDTSGFVRRPADLVNAEDDPLRIKLLEAA